MGALKSHFTMCVTLGKLLNLSKPKFHTVQTKVNNK